MVLCEMSECRRRRYRGSVASTGRKKTLVTEESPGALSPAEVKDRLRALSNHKIHPFDQVENRTVMARADRLFEQCLGPVRQLVSAQATQFAEIMSSQDPRTIGKAREKLVKFLDSIEREGPHVGG